MSELVFVQEQSPVLTWLAGDRDGLVPELLRGLEPPLLQGHVPQGTPADRRDVAVVSSGGSAERRLGAGIVTSGQGQNAQAVAGRQRGVLVTQADRPLV